jgi:uncharacterized phage-associated protein
VSPAQKKKPKKPKKKKEEKEESVSKLTLAQKVQLAMMALTALGSGLGQGAVEAWQHSRQVPTVSAPATPNKQTEKLNYAAPQQKDVPTGDEPKQKLRFIYTNNQGEKQTLYSAASGQSLANATFRWAKPAVVQNQLKQEGDETLVIKAQLHPSAPLITVNVPKKDIADHIATLGDSSISAEDLASVKHIVISPWKPVKT